MLDTNICIYIIKKRPESVLQQLKKKKDKGLFISTVTLSELEFGIENSEHKEKNRIALVEFLTIIGIRHYDEGAARNYGIIKKDLKDKKCLIGPMDMLIAAHANSLNMVLVTNNTGEFARVKGLKVENWI
jgi:tRNA(fMet)-specific endonuclease VapC